MAAELSPLEQLAAQWGAQLAAARSAGRDVDFDLTICADGICYLLSRRQLFSPVRLTVDEGSSVPLKFTFEAGAVAKLLQGASSPQLLCRTGALNISGDPEQALIACSLLDVGSTQLKHLGVTHVGEE